MQNQNWIGCYTQWKKLKILDLLIKDEIQFRTKNCVNRVWLLVKLSGIFVKMLMVKAPLQYYWREWSFGISKLSQWLYGSISVLNMAMHIHHYRLGTRERTLYFWHKRYYYMLNLWFLGKKKDLFNPWWEILYHTQCGPLLTMT